MYIKLNDKIIHVADTKEFLFAVVIPLISDMVSQENKTQLVPAHLSRQILD